MKFYSSLACAGLALALTACGNSADTTDVQTVTWQISNVYTTPDYPSEIPMEVAGAAVMSFGGESTNGFTGCASFNGLVSFTADDKDAASPEDAQELSFTDLVFSPIDTNQCVGKIKYVHDALVNMMVDGTFTITHLPDGSMLLRHVDEDLESPGMKLTTL